MDSAPQLLVWDSIGGDGTKKACFGVDKDSNADVLRAAAASADGSPVGFILDYGAFGAEVKAPEIMARVDRSPERERVQIFQCIDVFGRGIPGELATGKSCAEALRRGHDVCIFAPGWAAERSDGSQASFEQLDDALWMPIVTVLQKGKTDCRGEGTTTE
jgi:hypothetical protein